MSQLQSVCDLTAEPVSASAVKLAWRIPAVELGSGYAVRFSFRIFRRRQVCCCACEQPSLPLQRFDPSLQGAADFVLAHSQDDAYQEHVVESLNAFQTYEFYVQTFSYQLAVGSDDKDWPCSEIVRAKTKATVSQDGCFARTQLRLMISCWYLGPGAAPLQAPL